MNITDFKKFNVYLMDITVPMATEWLQVRNHHNRYRRPSVVAMIARDLEAGKWLRTGETISFDWFGETINGQHRFGGVVKSGITMPDQIVVVGLDPAVRTVIDTQSRRTVRDAFAHAGHKQMVGEGGTVGGNTAAGMWTRMKYGIRQVKGVDTRQELLVFAETYPEGGLFAIESFGTLPRAPKISTAPVMAAAARAYYHYEDAAIPRLERFIHVLVTGKSVNELESSIHDLRRFLSGLKEDGTMSRNAPRNSNAHHEIYGKTCRAIQAFMQGETLGRLYLPQTEPFPLPDRASATGVSDRVLGDSGRTITGRPGALEVATPLPLGRPH